MEADGDCYNDEDESLFTDDLVDESADGGVDLLVRRFGSSRAQDDNSPVPPSSSSLGADDSSLTADAVPGAVSPSRPALPWGFASARYIGSVNDDDGERETVVWNKGCGFRVVGRKC
jgi:hypothetical protein